MTTRKSEETEKLIAQLKEQVCQSEQRILELKNYLTSKDYQTIREMQGGEPMDDETKKACADARAEINELEAKIKADEGMIKVIEEEKEKEQANEGTEGL